MCQRRGGQKGGYPKKRERKNKNMKLHGQDPWTTLARLCTFTMSTMINHCPVTKAQPFKPTLYKFYCLGLLAYEPVWDRYKLSPYNIYIYIYIFIYLFAVHRVHKFHFHCGYILLGLIPFSKTIYSIKVIMVEIGKFLRKSYCRERTILINSLSQHTKRKRKEKLRKRDKKDFYNVCVGFAFFNDHKSRIEINKRRGKRIVLK